MPGDTIVSVPRNRSVDRRMMLLACCFVLTGCQSIPGADSGSRTDADSGDATVDVRDALDGAEVAPETGRDTDSGWRDGRPSDVETEDVDVETRPDAGERVGSFWNTYYYLSDESAYSGPDDTSLYDDDCRPVADVPSKFANQACIEGSARLESGAVVNYDEPCSCGPCSFCWSKLDANRYPWGKGSQGNALEPLRSWAVDTDVIAFGTVLYVPKWDGVEIPRVGELGGFTHDGCFRADDVGGGIEGNHFDLFAGTPAMRSALEKKYPTRTNFEVYRGASRCSHLDK